MHGYNSRITDNATVQHVVHKVAPYNMLYIKSGYPNYSIASNTYYLVDNTYYQQDLRLFTIYNCCKTSGLVLWIELSFYFRKAFPTATIHGSPSRPLLIKLISLQWRHYREMACSSSITGAWFDCCTSMHICMVLDAKCLSLLCFLSMTEPVRA